MCALLEAAGALVNGATSEYAGPARRSHVVDMKAIGPTLHRQRILLATQVAAGADEAAIAHALRRPLALLGRRYDEAERTTGVRRAIAVDGIRTEIGHLRIERHSIDHLRAGHRDLAEGVGLRVAGLYAEPLRVSASNLSNLQFRSDNGAMIAGFGANGTRVHWVHGIVARRPDVVLRHDSATLYQRMPEAAVANMPGRRLREIVAGTPADDYVIRAATLQDDGEEQDGKRQFRLELSLRSSCIPISDANGS